jgi:hypothetical protein
MAFDFEEVLSRPPAPRPRRRFPLFWAFTLRRDTVPALVSLGGPDGVALLAFLMDAHRRAPLSVAVPSRWAAVVPWGAEGGA